MGEQGDRRPGDRWVALGFALVAFAVSAAFLPLSSWFRAEDLIDFEHYHRIGLLGCFERSHLDTELVAFYRPLSDALTWLLVRTLGPSQTAMHSVLLALHVAVALMAMLTCRSLVGGGLARAIPVGALIVAHPFVPLTVLYLDGGVPQLLFALCTLGAVKSLLAWRRGEGRGVSMTLWTLAAVFSFDGGLALPLGLVVGSLIAPTCARSGPEAKTLSRLDSAPSGSSPHSGPRRFPWWLLLALPAALLVRNAAIGTPLGGYALAPSRANVQALSDGLPQVAKETVLPVFGDRHDPKNDVEDLHPAGAETAAWIVLAGVTLAAVVLALRGADPVGRAGRGLRWLIAGLVLFGAVFVPGALEAALGMGNGGPFAPSFGYRLYPALVVLCSILGGLCAAASRRADLRAGWVLGVPIVLGWGWLGAPLRDGAGEAGERARSVRDGVVALAAAAPEDDRPFVVLATPSSRVVGPRDLGRVLNFGLANACRPPLLSEEIEAYPVFSGRGGEDLTITAASIERLIQCPALRVVQYDASEDSVFEWPTETGEPAAFELLPPSGLRRDPRHAAAEAETVRVDDDGRLGLRVRGETPGVLRLVLVNKLHPFYAWEREPLHCERIEDPDRDSDLLVASATQFLEAARREPDELCFAILEQLPSQEITPATYAAAVASEVLVIRFGRQ